MGGQKKDNINRLMMLAAVNQDELADIAKVGRAAVSHWVNGRSEPRDVTCEIIASYYGLEPRNLIERDGMKHVKVGSDGKLREDKEALLADRIGSLREMTGTSDEADIDEMLRNVQTIIDAVEMKTRTLDADEKELLCGFGKLNDEGRSLILQTINAYVKSAVFAQR